MRGKLGNEVFTKNRSGAISRAYVVPSNTITAYRTLVRGYWADVVSLWSSVDANQLLYWQELNTRVFGKSSIGNRFKMTARNLFIKCNYSLLCADQLPTLTPAVYSPYEPCTSLVVNVLSVSNIQVTANSVAKDFTVPLNHVAVISASPSVSAGINYPRNNFIRIQIVDELEALDALDVTDKYTDVFGAPVVGQKVFFRCHFVNVLNGLTAPPVTTSAIVI